MLKVLLNPTNQPAWPRPRLYHAARPHAAPDDAVSLTQTDRLSDRQTVVVSISCWSRVSFCVFIYQLSLHSLTDTQTNTQTDRQSCQFVYVHLSTVSTFTHRHTDKHTDRQTVVSVCLCSSIISLYIHSQTVSESVSLEYSPVQCLNNDILYASHDQC